MELRQSIIVFKYMFKLSELEKNYFFLKFSFICYKISQNRYKFLFI